MESRFSLGCMVSAGGAFIKAYAGDTIKVAAGTYIRSGQLTLNKAKITLAGSGSIT
jgi:hypothetical protein